MSKALILICLIFCFVACNKTPSDDKSTIQVSASAPSEPSIQKGENIYKSVCTSCHAQDPKIQGPVGPKLYGSPFKLLESKVLKGEYPSGYTPQRSTKVMPKFTNLEKDLKSIELYLNQ